MTRVSGASNGSQPLDKGKLSRVSDETLQKIAALVSLVCIGLLIAGIVTHVQQTLAFEWNVSMMSVGGAGLLLIGLLVKVGLIPDPAKNRVPLPKSSHRPATHVPTSSVSTAAKAPLPPRPKKPDEFSKPTSSLTSEVSAAPETFEGMLRRKIDLGDMVIQGAAFSAKVVNIVKGDSNSLTIQGPEANVRSFKYLKPTFGIAVDTENGQNLDMVLTLEDPSKLGLIMGSNQADIRLKTPVSGDKLLVSLKDKADLTLGNIGDIKKQKIRHLGTGTYFANTNVSEDVEIAIRGKGTAFICATKSVSGSLSAEADCQLRANKDTVINLSGRNQTNLTVSERR